MCVWFSFASVSLSHSIGLCPTAAVCPPPLPPGPALPHPTSAAVVLLLLRRLARDAQASQWKLWLRGSVAGPPPPRSLRHEVSSAHTAPPRPPSLLNPPRAPNLRTETYKTTDAHQHMYPRVGVVSGVRRVNPQ
eukprot:GHVU01158152.1.p1 GENE.GHVU01158152.1~~GHVU01158152.1.p1  ORF type:complete len:134 (-),score=2.59 GHVU01158152.1:126-527(-)